MRPQPVVYPFLWSREAQEGPVGTSRSPVAMAELLGLDAEFCVRFEGVGPRFLGLLQPGGDFPHGRLRADHLAFRA